ncbi:alpha/beta-hydrolase [Pyrenochaeta sp. DS3sAY3a]|nr:alpha/beta-hydrolase [Pyrenochaeta sp. DS3sAY3a]
MSRISSFVAVGLLASAALAFPTLKQTRRTISDTGMVSSFEDVPHSADLHWTPCYEHYHCANLEVPLDYAEPEIGTTIVAFIRQPGSNSTGQDVLFNPGGPGGSGVNFILSGGGDEIINAAGGLIDIVSFDPRGVNNSAIDLTCFPGNPDARDAYFASLSAPRTLNEGYATALARGEYCSAVNNDTFAKYAGTSAVVQDMIHFTELQAAQDGHPNPEDADIWYYGVSYGTVIGHTLAALYPERVGRIVVDGNVDSEGYYNGLTTTSVEDADDGYEWFFQLCYEAGLEKCAFAGESSSAADIKKRFDDLLAKLEKTPLVSSDPEINPQLSFGPEIITKSRVLNLAFGTLYAPFSQFPYLAAGLAGLEANNATVWFAVEKLLSGASDPGPFNYTSSATQEVLAFVTSIDSATRYPIKNVDDYIKVVAEIEETSVYAGRSYSESNVLLNAGSKITPPESQYFPGFKKTKTKNPVFFINTSADPITPASSAKHMSQYFEGSVVLIQNSVGHGFTSVTSSCSFGHVGAYLVDATMPPEGTICEADTKPLVDSPALQKRNAPAIVRRQFLW